MSILGLSPALLIIFVGFGFVVGVFFSFFGMGGSFLVTPTLLLLGYPAPVAIGSSMAFVFGTAIIATLKHHDVGEVDYKLGASMFVGIALGIEAGRYAVFFLDALGRAELAVSVAYVVLLAAIGALFIWSALDEGSDSKGDDEIPEIARRIKSYDVAPMVTLADGSRASIWTISGVGGGVGVVSGFLGVGGGFIRMPAIYYVIGVPLTVAVGTSLFGALMSGAVGTFTYGLSGVVDLGIVTALLIGSALGARIGSAATAYVEESDVTIYFGGMLLAASVAVAVGELATWLGVAILDRVSFVLLVGSALFVMLVIFYYSGRAIRTGEFRESTKKNGS